MHVAQTRLAGVVVLVPDIFRDARGDFSETWSARRYAELGLPREFIQDNVSRSWKNVVRGLHLQSPPMEQAKLVAVAAGEIFDVAVDVRVGSPTFGRWAGEILSAENRKQLFIPEGFAHGFCALSTEAIVAYKCTQYYAREAELGLRWNDPAIGIAWPVEAPVLSERDAQAPLLSQVPEARLPRMGAGHRG